MSNFSIKKSASLQFHNIIMDKNRSFRPKRRIQKGEKGYKLRQLIKHTLGTGDPNKYVELPEGEMLLEWISVHIIEFYNEINLIYGALVEFCTDQSCRVMSAGPRYEFRWTDQNSPIPLQLSAPQYINKLMEWIEGKLNDRNLFPTELGVDFPSNFIPSVKVMLKRLFRVYAHLYHTHMQKIIEVEMLRHINTSFKHFLFFVLRFDLVSEEEMSSLGELIKEFKDEYGCQPVVLL
ncbi:unnamed protein product [Blepharisma stoltei]|uniref:MOB kinase activator-like 1 n=1 Tax=Blepharisma stoltei TaxID=1481888 RepID=A0AAU9J4C7_9CILI|nr:unnamed protein product [Blepharisma stoltei]